MATPANRIPVRVARGAKADLVASAFDLYEGEICYATDENRLYVVEGGALTASTVAPSSIDALTDVDTTTAAPTTGQILRWDGTNWTPSTPSIQSNTAGITGAVQVTNVVKMTQAAYDALGTYNASTLYVIV